MQGGADGGLSLAELTDLLARVAEACPVRAFGLASYDPAADDAGAACEAALEAAVALVTGASRSPA